MLGENVEHTEAVFNTTARSDSRPEYDLLTFVVQAGAENKARIRRWHNRPSSEASCHFGHILLCIPAINPQSMKLHELAPVIFIQTRPSSRHRVSVGVFFDGRFSLT